MNLNKLLEIEEYAAYGFYEAQNRPYPFAYAHALRCLYEMQPARILEDHILVPAEPFYMSSTSYGDAMNAGLLSHARGLDRLEGGSHHAKCAIYNQFHSSGLTVYTDVAEEKKKKYPEHAGFIDELVKDLSSVTVPRSGYMHNNPDTVTVLRKGFRFMIQEIEEEITKAKEENDTEGLNYLYAMQDYAQGVVAYYNKHKKALVDAVGQACGDRKRKLSVILEGYEKCFLEPAVDFVSAMLSVNLCWMLDGCDSIGRLDYILGEFLERDLAEGKIEITFVREMLDDLWSLFERYNGWNLQIGGATPEGKDCYNILTKECLLCNARNKTRRPNLALRVTGNMPEDIWNLAVDSIAVGNGKPALYNDELYMKTLHQYFPEIEADDLPMYGLGGCSETMITCMSSVDSLCLTTNLTVPLMAALFNGVNIYTGQKCGLETGEFKDFKTYDDFLSALKLQIDDEIQRMADFINSYSPCDCGYEYKNLGDPRIVRSMFTRGCTANRKPFDMGGAKYNWAVVSFHGTTVLTDSLAAIKKCIFDDKTISAEKLIRALQCNFEGYEDVQRLLKNVDKFGNDIEWVDQIAGDIMGYAWDKTLEKKHARGGFLVPSVIIFATYENAGKEISALPNGRCAGQPLNDSIGAFEGADTNGPTALINSVVKLPQTKAFGTPIFNMRLSKNLVNRPGGKETMINLLKTYFQKGGMQIQISVLSTEEMRAAQKEPEKYRDMIVRIGGYSEFFVYLSPKLQETVIKRSEMLP